VISVEEAAKLLGIGWNLCYDKGKTGKIPVTETGRRLLVPRTALEELLVNPQPLNPTLADK
jgi:excisionase family DNA binding protein